MTARYIAPGRAPRPRSSTASFPGGGSPPDPQIRVPASPPTAGARDGSGRDGGRAAGAARASAADALGPLSRFAVDPAVTDIFVNGDGGLWIDRGSGAVNEPGWAPDERTRRSLAVSLVSAGGRHIDDASPCVDVRLASGIRVHAVLPPVAPRGTLISVRIPRSGGWSLGELRDQGMFDDATAARLRRVVDRRLNVLVTGGGGAGKTTLLAAMLASAPPNERIVAIEDVAELGIAHPQFVSLESRQANLEGAGELGLERLLREALRMRPDRLILGECRGAELRELLSALNTGHDGGAGTMHANSIHDVASRLEALGALAGMSASAVAGQAVSALDLVIHLERRDGVRRLVGFGRFAIDDRGRLVVEDADDVEPEERAR